MEEIDSIELLKRVKEGKAPKIISINNLEYCYEDGASFGDYYRDTEKYGKVFLSNDYDFRSMANIKIKILDEPILEELDTIIGDLENPSHNEILILNLIRNNRIKINEIIKHINKE